MSLKLYWSPDSANLVIRIALEMLELPYETVRINRRAGDHKRPDFLARNPQGLLPVLEDGPLTLFETGAILWHLIERTGRLGPDGPDADQEPARVAALKWMFWLSNTLHADLRSAFYSQRYVPDEMVSTFRDGLRSRICQHCDLIDGEVRQGGLIGPSISIPDVYLSVCLRWAQIYPPGQIMIEDPGRWPAIHAVSARIEALATARKAFEAEYIDPFGALTAARPPLIPPEEVTGTI